MERSHGEYWLQVSAQRLLKVECAEERHVSDMGKLEACIDKVTSVIHMVGVAFTAPLPHHRLYGGGNTRTFERRRSMHAGVYHATRRSE